MSVWFWSVFISKPLIVLNFLTVVLVLEPLHVHCLIQWLRNMGDSLHLNWLKLCVQFLDALCIFLVPNMHMRQCSPQSISSSQDVLCRSTSWNGATTQQTKQKPHLYLLPKSPSSLVSAVQSQSLQTLPWLEFSRLTSPTDALFCKYSFLGMVSTSYRCFLFLVDPVSGPRILLGLSWSSPVFIQ